MARKHKAQEAPAKDGPIFVTYVGPQGAVSYMGRGFAKDVPVEVTADELPMFASRSFFKVTHGNAHAG